MHDSDHHKLCPQCGSQPKTGHRWVTEKRRKCHLGLNITLFTSNSLNEFIHCTNGWLAESCLIFGHQFSHKRSLWIELDRALQSKWTENTRNVVFAAETSATQLIYWDQEQSKIACAVSASLRLRMVRLGHWSGWPQSFQFCFLYLTYRTVCCHL